jgi:predicted GIY-YIG superfamily endonuclease
LVYFKEYKTFSKALKAEKELKNWTIKEKEELIKAYENRSKQL